MKHWEQVFGMIGDNKITSDRNKITLLPHIEYMMLLI